MDANENDSPKQAPLNQAQRLGMDSLGLSETKVRTANFGQHTIDGINELVTSRRATGNNQAFNILRELDATQTDGVLAGLSRENVTTQNFGGHTLIGMDQLTFRDENISQEAAFQALSGLNAQQVDGIIRFQLTKQQVNTPNFGQHTLDGIQTLKNKSPLRSNENAYRQIAGFNPTQTEGSIEFGLTRNQVENPMFTATILKTIDALQRLNPAAETETIYNYAIEMPEYQSRAIANFGFSPEEMGIQAAGQSFVMTDTTVEKEIASGSTVDAAAFLMEEYMSINEAKETASKLNTTQIIGMVDMGLSLEQVQTPFFEEAENVLNQVFQELQSNENDIELPLTGQSREEAREILGRMILDSTTREALQDINMADDISVTSDNSMILENIEPLSHLKPLEGTDIDEFLKYTSSLQELDILDSIQSRIQEVDIKQDTAAIEETKGNLITPDANSKPKGIDFSAFTTPSSPIRANGKDAKRKSEDSKMSPLSPRTNKESPGTPERKSKRRKR